MTSPTQSTTERVGRYQLLEPIGVGPSGTVSRAKVFGVAGFERQFAIKRFHGELTATASLAQALSAAARAYGGLEHPRIARMSEFGVAQGTTFTAVEFVVGLDALRLIGEIRLAGTSLAAGGALALVSQAARAVGYAHGRGLTHLGLSPTNVIVTGDGDVKITDFGILSASLPQRPIEVVRLANRIQYLAPEQLANEATSAATDVFALGVLAYELVTGQRTFKGETPQQIAQSVMGGPPAEPPLPRPIVRVLQRCLARSPFERFPDARALADALDAALRVAPVPGTRKDIGVQVTQTLERLAALHSGELSGMVALNVGVATMKSAGATAPVPSLGNRNTPMPVREILDGIDAPTTPLAGPGSVSLSELADHARSASTLPDLPRPMTTMTGLAPPPIPVPAGISSPAQVPMPPPVSPSHAPATLLGIPPASKSIPTLPSITPRPPPIPQSPSGATPPALPKQVFRPTDTAPGAPPVVPPARPTPHPATTTSRLTPVPRPTPPPRATTPAPLPPPDAPTPTPPPIPPAIRPQSEPTASQALTIEPRIFEPGRNLDATVPGIGIGSRADHGGERTSGPVERPELLTNEMSPALTAQLVDESSKPTAEYEAVSGEAAWKDEAGMSALPPLPSGSPVLGAPPRAATPPPWDAGNSAPRDQRDIPTMAIREAPPSPNKQNRWLLIGTVSAIVIAGGIWLTHDMFGRSRDEAPVVANAPDAGTKPDARQVAIAASDAAIDAAIDAASDAASDAAAVPTALDAGSAVPPGDAVAAQVIDAGAPPVIDAAAQPAIDAGATATPSDSLVVTSKPAGARVFLDGADMGVTPLKQPGTADRHTLAIMLPGHELYVAQVDGKGSFAIPLKEVTPTGGPAGIKVLKCKDKDRYYVFVDGKPTGQTCPTERIETEVGSHVVEVYDVTNDSRRKWEIDVKDTRLSVRVKID